MPVIVVKKEAGKPDTFQVTARGTNDSGPFEERVEITRGVTTKVSDAIFNAVKRSDYPFAEIVEEKKPESPPANEEKQPDPNEGGQKEGTDGTTNA